PENRAQLKSWLESRSPEFEKDDPPAACKLTDLSPGACYLEIVAPFPVRTRVILSMRFADLQLSVEGVVRVMHPEIGMGVEFTQTSAQQREHLEKFINALTSSKSSVPELMVEPEGQYRRASRRNRPLPCEWLSERSRTLDIPSAERLHNRDWRPASLELR